MVHRFSFVRFLVKYEDPLRPLLKKCCLIHRSYDVPPIPLDPAIHILRQTPRLAGLHGWSPLSAAFFLDFPPPPRRVSTYSYSATVRSIDWPLLHEVLLRFFQIPPLGILFFVGCSGTLVYTMRDFYLLLSYMFLGPLFSKSRHPYRAEHLKR